MDNGLTPAQDAWLRSQAHREAFEDMSAAQINALPMSEFARLTGRSFKVQPEPAAEPAAAPQSAPQVPESRPQGFDPDSPEYFHAWRAQRTRGGEGVGIFDSVSSRSEAYRSAARAQAGRTGWANSNVIEPPKLTGRYVRQDDMRDTRTVAQRFSNQATMWQGR